MIKLTQFFIIALLSTAPFMASADSVAQTKKWFVSGGFNQSLFNDIRYDIQSEDYDFTLTKIEADNAEVFKNNISVGYFFDENYAVSMGVDQLRYALENGQSVRITGDIENVNSEIDGEYYKQQVTLTDDFLMFDDTDAINYLFVDHSYYSEYHEFTPLAEGNVTAHWLVGLSAGMMMPQTNAMLFSQDSFDKLYLAGAGVNVKVGANLFLGQHFFVQSEMKVGYANLWNVKMSEDELTDVTQQFNFGQINVSVGGLL